MIEQWVIESNIKDKFAKLAEEAIIERRKNEVERIVNEILSLEENQIQNVLNSITKEMEKKNIEKLERQKLHDLIASHPKRRTRAGEILFHAVLFRGDDYGDVNVRCISDLEKITWSEWRKRKIYTDTNRLFSPGPASWKLLKECIKKSKTGRW